MPVALSFSDDAILRIVRSLIAAELNAAGRRIPVEESALWPASLALDDSGLALDSLDRLGCATAANTLFHLHETGIEDYLLAARTLADWVKVVRAALAEGTSGITFATSGSTGRKRPCFHPAAELLAEASHWAAVYADRIRIVAFVPFHHIYGCLFTALLPDLLGVPVLDARPLPPGLLRRELAPGDLLVGFPTGFNALLPSLRGRPMPPGIAAVSSTAPLPAATHGLLLWVGLDRVTEVYGSSETGGIAARDRPTDAFRLLSRWRPGAGGAAATVHDTMTGGEIPLPDRAEWQADGTLRLLGRKDDAVQVGGVNVYPALVAERLRGLPLVADCAVRLDTGLAEPRLKAFVVPAPGAEPRQVAEAVEAWCRAELAAPERPVRIETGTALPRSELGKLADWQVAA